MSSALVATGERDGLTPLWQATIAAIASRDPAFTARLDAAKDALRTRSDVSPLIDLAGELPPAPDLEAALVA
jgi:hypothetical protein